MVGVVLSAWIPELCGGVLQGASFTFTACSDLCQVGGGAEEVSLFGLLHDL